MQDYVANNHIKVDLNEKQTNLGDIFLDDLQGNEVFLSSEEHAVLGNKKLEIKLLDYFVEKAGVKYLLVEYGYCQAMRFNRYLESGDESILEEEVKSLKGTLSYTKDFAIYWQQLFELNQKLSDKNKIKIIGIDLGWTPSVVKYFEEELRTIALKDLPSLQNLLHNYNNTTPQGEYRELYEKVLSEFSDADKSVFTDQQKFEIPYVFENLINSAEAFSQEEPMDIHRKRDKYMYDNFIKLYPRLDRGKFFGQWGLNHVYQAPQLNVNWLAYLLNSQENSPVKGKVLSMATYYRNCERIKWKTEETQLLDSFTISPDSLGISFDKDSIYLVRLNAPNSPFEKELLWYGPNRPDLGVTTDYHEYMIIGNQLPASTPYE